VPVRAVSGLNFYSRLFKSALIKVNHRVQQFANARVLGGDYAVRFIKGGICDLRDTTYFFLGKPQILAAFLGNCRISFSEVQQAQECIERIIDLVGGSGGEVSTTGCSRFRDEYLVGFTHDMGRLPCALFGTLLCSMVCKSFGVGFRRKIAGFA
jgi:hypothetical protein